MHDADRLERLFVIAAVLTVAWAVLLKLASSNGFLSKDLAEVASHIDINGILFSAGFAIINLRSWKILVLMMLGGAPTTVEEGDEDKTDMAVALTAAKGGLGLLFLLKSCILISLFLLVTRGSSVMVNSFLLGFTSFLFIGILLAALFLRPSRGNLN